MKHRCGTELVWEYWNTEEGETEGWYCPTCDVYNAKPMIVEEEE